MRYAGMPAGMWTLFRNSFRKNLGDVLGYDREKAGEVTEKAKKDYRMLIRRLPEFEKGDRFKMNIVNCALFSAFCLHMHPKPTLEQMTEFYNRSMMIPAMRFFCWLSGRKKFTAKDIEGMKKTEALRAADRNPYSWNMIYIPYQDGSGYEARFFRCGICRLMKELNLYEYVPAMCRLDYTMADASRASRFVREYTLASGGPYCDCGYKKLN